MRRKIKEKRTITPDETYDSIKVSKLINYVMERGKKNASRRVVYDAMVSVKDKAKVDNPLEIFEMALKNTAPNMEVKSRRVGGANYQVPIEVRPERKQALSIKWIIDAARNKKGKPMSEKLADEIISASKNEGDAVKKRENVHKMAEANKAFAHFSW
ncbi:MAG: 30S ribosomal protein S7 [Candidatus Taylorbacteria bacterium RIFCSPLOWO2_12_FULL_43_20]|uniref:Small ribosomal subunit protein uS7 n=1 Tax=Candidatus Taylorbacteria bacterium RIFCSPLOWO2_12_FULL_43_20 TaxID=1802332 RepID=A0A1G2P4G8_9BACT|nr:MAG: 30S ribosomal protein S7 [Candidatus Taylorbacteria bacterium RIFCSPHIGHO2_01_FULL_43_120]OHA22237.1 MAG: 30S ribosomal protein S7 [Candidatus Taylorbacteria bacterium RIFCSPHIGHO2_02_FULL_43_55]OHA28257.1 MAG: 30S ribosomal protein S7 [Candidatus Taylorbacteria bacterium RIFCSPHIGHO2_12_FULL_42_34]OHA30408.1 MAG: 30S ribosomal protein S7 [Candidatus Taylorbacteria bacterium RIFCSPLOWO2_01_FULL_43_83]OHA39661.1 MAG: 30S ribosomal protein S7 [Candidatus Taylorbacteria bacterium RIFCSPLOW